MRAHQGVQNPEPRQANVRFQITGNLQVRTVSGQRNALHFRKRLLRIEAIQDKECKIQYADTEHVEEVLKLQRTISIPLRDPEGILQIGEVEDPPQHGAIQKQEAEQRDQKDHAVPGGQRAVALSKIHKGPARLPVPELAAAHQKSKPQHILNDRFQVPD